MVIVRLGKHRSPERMGTVPEEVKRVDTMGQDSLIIH